tara:strand:- start:3120 stop:3281 length:162 start_codon:yes stop_codon:yes gene_type:complete
VTDHAEPTPTHLNITPRDLRFGRGRAMKRYWLNDEADANAALPVKKLIDNRKL